MGPVGTAEKKIGSYWQAVRPPPGIAAQRLPLVRVARTLRIEKLE